MLFGKLRLTVPACEGPYLWLVPTCEEMEKMIEKLRAGADEFLSELNTRAEEVRENFESFQGVFGKEFNIQKEHLKEYREKMEFKGKDALNLEEQLDRLKGTLRHGVVELRAVVDGFFDRLRDTIDNAR
jgi:hypothetical protein